MVEVPLVTPQATPVEEPIVATAVLPLIQEPPGVVLLSVVQLPIQAKVAPVIAAGSGLTVTTAVT
jgi:hypothetical protein